MVATRSSRGRAPLVSAFGAATPPTCVGGEPSKFESYISFSDEEIAYLQSNALARLATVDPDSQPDVVPIALEFDADGGHFWVGGGDVLATRKFRNVAQGNDRVAFVVDDMESVDPFIARGIRVYGIATGPTERVGMVGPGQFLKITPHTSWSWNLAGEPLVGSTWYPVRRTDHHSQ